jgi:hypothetical protein
MARLLDAKTIKANRALIRAELVDRGMAPVGADAACDAWEQEARRLGTDRRFPDFWTLGSVWTKEQEARRRAS